MSTLTEPHTNGHDRELGGVRTYRGRKLEDLIPQIRAELGPDAIILRQREGLMGGVGGFFAQKCVEVDAQAAPRVDIYDDDKPVNGWEISTTRTIHLRRRRRARCRRLEPARRSRPRPAALPRPPAFDAARARGVRAARARGVLPPAPEPLPLRRPQLPRRPPPPPPRARRSRSSAASSRRRRTSTSTSWSSS